MIYFKYFRGTKSEIEGSTSEMYFSKESGNESSILSSISIETQSPQIDAVEPNPNIDPTVKSFIGNIEYVDTQN